jgi:hypothetical protein
MMTRGDNSLLGIVDTNIDDRDYIIHKKLFGYNDNKKHSESVLGIIFDKNIKGLSDKAKVCFAGIVMDGTYGSFINALKWIRQFDLDVLNLSLAYSDNNPELYDLLFEISRNTIILSAYSEFIGYPHKYSFVVSVGNDKNQDADVIVDVGFGRKNELYKGTSMSCAFVSSIACLARSFDKSIDRNVFIEKICGNERLEIKTMFDNKRQHNIVL